MFNGILYNQRNTLGELHMNKVYLISNIKTYHL